MSRQFIFLHNYNDICNKYTVYKDVIYKIKPPSPSSIFQMKIMRSPQHSGFLHATSADTKSYYVFLYCICSQVCFMLSRRITTKSGERFSEVRDKSDFLDLPGESPMKDLIGLCRILSGSCLLQDPMKIIVRILAGTGSCQ